MSLPDCKIYQYNVSLKGLKQKIWRRVQVPENYTFWDMHVAIQDIMPWQDYHLHRFEVTDKNSGIIVSIGRIDEMLGITVNERDAKLNSYFIAPKDKGTYLYDFGMDWLHEIVLESITPAIPGVKYPQCTAGKNQCFPEDGNGDPPNMPFDCHQVKFKDPEEVWLTWFGHK